jgi:hypothetical protein
VIVPEGHAQRRLHKALPALSRRQQLAADSRGLEADGTHGSHRQWQAPTGAGLAAGRHAVACRPSGRIAHGAGAGSGHARGGCSPSTPVCRRSRERHPARPRVEVVDERRRPASAAAASLRRALGTVSAVEARSLRSRSSDQPGAIPPMVALLAAWHRATKPQNLRVWLAVGLSRTVD